MTVGSSVIAFSNAISGGGVLRRQEGSCVIEDRRQSWASSLLQVIRRKAGYPIAIEA